jgi:tetratricopeptide (TPR) repeat protein
MDDAEEAADAASAWLAQAKGAERASAGECLGVALSVAGQWGDATTAFRAAQDVADKPEWRARLGGMAGEAALNADDPAKALAALDLARADASGNAVLTAGIAIYRARALVALKREPEAATALAEARAAAPANPQAWLLSATLSRRQGKLADAQAQIQRAAELLPLDPEIGLEAGLIAVLSGHDEAARKSWQSVIAAAPQSDAAATARTYLGQLGPAAAGATIGR